MFQRFDFAVLGYALLGMWMGVLLFHVLVVVPVSSRLLGREQLGEFALAVQRKFHLWGIVLSALATLSLLLGGETSATVLATVVLASVLFSEYLRRRVRSILKELRRSPNDSKLKGSLFETYRFIAYATYTQAIAGLGAIVIGWLRL
ncbi:MAG: DUF4149 domain-containing protein [Thermotogae bacterium]|nr:DUF4149 domain-containing protein [Thermotogota bacterium]